MASSNETRAIELKLILTSQGDLKLVEAEKSIRALVTLSEHASTGFSRMNLQLQRLVEGFERFASVTGTRGGGNPADGGGGIFGRVFGGSFLGTLTGNLLPKLLNQLERAKDATVGFFTDSFKSVVQTAEAYQKYQLALEGVLRSQEAVNRVSRIAFDVGSKAPIGGIGDFERASQTFAKSPAQSLFFGDNKDVERNLRSLFETTARLASTDPDRGIPGAVQAIRLALQGQFRQLQRTYQIGLNDLVQESGKSAKELKRSSEDIIAAIDSITKRLTSDDQLRRLGRTVGESVSDIREYIENIIPRTIGGKGFLNVVQGLFVEVEQSLLDFVKPGGSFETKFAQGFSDSFSRIVLAIAEIAGNSIKIILGIVGGPGGSSNPFEAIAQQIEKFANKVADFTEGFAKFTSTEAGKELLTDIFDTIITKIKGFIEALVGFIEFLPKLAPLVGVVVTAVSTAVKALASLVDFLFSKINQFLTFLFDLPIFGSDDKLKALRQEEVQRQTGTRLAGHLGAARGIQGSRPQFELDNSLLPPTEIESLADALNDAGGDPALLLKGVQSRFGLSPVGVRAFAQSIQDAELASKLEEIAKSIEGIGKQSGDAQGPVEKFLKAVDAYRGTLGREPEDPAKASRQRTDFTISGFLSRTREFVSQGSNLREELEKSLLTPLELATDRIDDIDAVTTRLLKNLSDDLAREENHLFVELLFGDDPDAAVAQLNKLYTAWERTVKLVGDSDSIQKLGSAHTALKELLAVDPQEVSRFESALQAVEEAFRTVSGLDTAFGTKALGEGLLRAGASSAIQTGLAEARRNTEGFTAFGGGAGAQIAQNREVLRLLEEQGGSAGKLLDRLRSIADKTGERRRLEEIIAELLGIQVNQLDKQNAVLNFRKGLGDAQDAFQERLSAVTTGGIAGQNERQGILGGRIAEVQSQMAELNEEFQSGAINADEFKGKTEALTDVLKGLTRQNNELTRSIAEQNKQREIQNILQNTFGGQLAQSLNLTGTDPLTGEPIIKTASDVAREEGTQFGIQFVQGVQSGLGDSLFKLFKGEFDSIGDVWNSLMDSMLRAFADMIAQMLVRSLFSNVLGGLFGGLTGGGGGGGILGGGGGGGILSAVTGGGGGGLGTGGGGFTPLNLPGT